MESEARFSKKISCLNAWMLLLVIVMHGNNLYLYRDAGPFSAALQNFVCYNLCEAGVPVLLFVSAFLLYRNLSASNLAEKLKRRVFTLLLPYLLWNALYFAFFFAATRIPGFSGALLSAPVPLTASSLLSGIFLYAYNPAAWFLLQLILYAAACPVLYFLLKRRGSSALLILAVLALNLLPVSLWPLRLDALFYYLLGAAAGVHARAFFERRISVRLRALGLSGLLLYEIGFYAETLFGFAVPAVLLRTLLLFSVYFLFDALTDRALRPPLSRSFFVYVSHMLALGAVRVLLYLFLPHTPVCSILTWLAAIALTVAVCEAAGALLERFLPACYRVLTGGRRAFRAAK